MAGHQEPTSLAGLHKPYIHPSFFTRISNDIKTFLLYYVSELIFWNIRRRRPSYWVEQEPTLIKSFPVRPSLPVRIHLPPNHSTDDRHPLVFLIHGGGWFLGEPYHDDEHAHFLAEKGYIVISPKYRKGSAHRYPTPLNDLSAVLSAILDEVETSNDASTTRSNQLPIDTSRVTVMGFSAGGNMSLGLAQLPGLKSRIHAVVGIAPGTDKSGYVHPSHFRKNLWTGKDDDLKIVYLLAQWSYLPNGQDMCDPLVSPVFVTREDIPQPVMVVTSGADTLCDEGYRLAKNFAGEQTAGLNMEESWETADKRVRYKFVPEMPHGFEHFWTQPPKGDWQRKLREAQEDLWASIVSWLQDVLPEVDKH